MVHKSRLVIIMFLAVFSLSACLKNTISRGYTLDEEVIDDISVGIDRKEQIAAMLGAPTSISDFDSDIWYYIYNQKEHVAFLSPDTVVHSVLAIEFDKSTGRVKNIDRYTKDDMNKVSFVSDRTPTEGHDLGLAEQLLGNIGRFNPEGGSLERAMERNR